MGWRDRLAASALLDANSAKSSGHGTAHRHIGTNGTIGIEGNSGKYPPAPLIQADEAADRTAIAADVWPGGRPRPTEPAADLVERLAVALAAPRPWQLVTDPAKAMPLLRDCARRRLARLDPIARGLLVQAEEAHLHRIENTNATSGGRAR